MINIILSFRHFVSDQSPSVKALLVDTFRHISHQFDTWHFNKVNISILFCLAIALPFQAIMKKIWKFGKIKSCEDLVEWQHSISKMIWWSIGSSKGPRNIFSRHSQFLKTSSDTGSSDPKDIFLL